MRNELYERLIDLGVPHLHKHLPIHDQLEDEVIKILSSLPLEGEEIYGILRYHPNLAPLLKDKLDLINILSVCKLLEIHPELVEFLPTKNITENKLWDLIRIHPQLIKHLKVGKPPTAYISYGG